MKKSGKETKSFRGRVAAIAFLALEYGVPAFLLVVLLWKLLSSALFGDAPMPQIPPDGYVAYEDRVYLRWHPGNSKGGYDLEVFQVDGNSRRRILEKQVSTNEIKLPALDPGKKYCWRVATGWRAAESCFTTSRAYLRY
jgi:hypothetical protein